VVSDVFFSACSTYWSCGRMYGTMSAPYKLQIDLCWVRLDLLTDLSWAQKHPTTVYWFLGVSAFLLGPFPCRNGVFFLLSGSWVVVTGPVVVCMARCLLLTSFRSTFVGFG